MFKVGDYIKVKNFNPKTLDWSKSFFSFINQKGKIVKIESGKYFTVEWNDKSLPAEGFEDEVWLESDLELANRLDMDIE